MPAAAGSVIVGDMTTPTTEMTQATQPLDSATAERLSARFGRVFETFEAGDLFAPDALFDLNMPVWRFQLVGGDAFAEQIRRISRGKVTLNVLRTVATERGFVHEHEEWQRTDDETYSARRLWLCDVRDGRICEAVGYCSGEWDEALRARHAVEAPMVRR
jgi:ketosteroid isomerase-like protein